MTKTPVPTTEIAQLITDTPGAEVVDFCDELGYVDIRDKAGKTTFMRVHHQFGFVVTAINPEIDGENLVRVHFGHVDDLEPQ